MSRCYYTRKLDEKSDVYSFGVVLLELITGRPAIITTDETIHVIQWVRAEIKKGDIRAIIDQMLQEKFHEDSVSRALEVALASTTSTLNQRATMEYVLLELKHCLDIELSKNLEQRIDLAPTHDYYVHSLNNGIHELPLMYTNSISMDSMTNPIGR